MSNLISSKLKKIVDNLVEKKGVDYCIRRAVKLNDMNYQILQHHVEDNNDDGIKRVGDDIRINEIALDYLYTLNKNDE